MPLGTKVGLAPGHIVLHGDPAPQAVRPLFGLCLLWSNGRPSQLLLSTCYILMSFDYIYCVSAIL